MQMKAGRKIGPSLAIASALQIPELASAAIQDGTQQFEGDRARWIPMAARPN
jgi:hypothetical protein